MYVYVFVTREAEPLLLPSLWATGTLGAQSVLYSVAQRKMRCFPEVSTSQISYIFEFAAMKQAGEFSTVCSLH